MIVGPQQAAITWHLPKALLTRQSLFFAAALNGSFAEAKLNSVTMPDDDPNVFRVWVQWLLVGYTNSETIPYEEVNNVLVKAWILGDKLGCHIFQDFIMTGLLVVLGSDYWTEIKPSTFRAAYEGSAPGSMLRKWAVDLFLFETRNKEGGKVSALQRNSLWFSEVKDVEGFSQDYMEASMKCSLESGPEDPCDMESRYMVEPSSPYNL